MPSLNDYLAFTALVEKKSFTGAANELHRSVSAVSKQLTKLEAKLEVQLIDRSTQSFAITELGHIFYNDCKAILSAVNEAEQNIKDQTGAPCGKVSISVPEVLLRTHFMALLHNFTEQYPQIKLDLGVSNEIDDIVHQQIDFAFRIGHEIDESSLTALALQTTEFVFCAAPKYLESQGQPRDIKSLLSGQKILLPTYVNLSEQIGKIFPAQDNISVNLTQAHSFNSEAAIYAAVREGMGVAMLLNVSIAEDLKQGHLIKLFPGQNYPKQTIRLIYNKRSYMPAKMRVFKDFIKQAFQ